MKLIKRLFSHPVLRSWQPEKIRRRLIYALLTWITFAFCLTIQPTTATHSPTPPLLKTEDRGRRAEDGNQNSPTPHSPLPHSLLKQSQQLYEARQYEAAIALLQQTITTAEQSGDLSTQVTAHRNLALIYQQLRQFDAAADAIATALPFLDAISPPQQSALRASLLDVQGGIEFAQGQPETALENWQQAEAIYDELGADQDVLQNRINQAQALQNLGFYRQAIALLVPITSNVSEQPDFAHRAIALRSLGDAWRLVGNFEQSKTALQTSIEMAQRLQRQDLVHTAQLSLANTFNANGESDRASDRYQMLIDTASGDIRAQALSNQIRLLIDGNQMSAAAPLWSMVIPHLDRLPISQSTLFTRVNVAQSFLKLVGSTSTETNGPSQADLAHQLAITIRQARALGDRRAESYAIGTLGKLYEQNQQWDDAQQLSETALQITQTSNATDIAYLWQWQLGRIYKALGDNSNDLLFKQRQYDKATHAYTDAVETLKVLRTDLASINAKVQVSFQESVEPIHRDLVSLLLDEERQTVTPEKIEQARQVIESLQLAELDNFFKEACLDKQETDVDTLDSNAAVIYPIMLRDRLEVVVSLPNQDLRHYATPIARDRIEELVRQLRQDLTLRIGTRFRSGVSELYDWMIRPAIADLESHQINTLVFVLDGSLRNVPMAALYDGQSFLVEHYSIAVTPGLQLVNSRPIQEQSLRVLTGALSEARQGFSALPNVLREVEQIQATVPSQVLLDESFTQESFQSALQTEAEPIVHLATHGNFSSNKDQTFLLTWDGVLDIASLNDVLRVSALNQQGPIELLVLSACQTAAGDKEAALGLAGMAVRAGSRSTVATLWQVNDEATALLMETFYQELASKEVSKAEALRQAQLRILQEPKFRQHPYVWAAFILVGNWL
ncbi:MAG: CHAT domain-containing protein [Leptolyngbyaceae cyanobacterium]